MEPNKKKILDQKYYWALAFAIAAAGMLIVYFVEGMLGGESIVLRSDMLSGNIAGMKCIARSLLNGETPWYSLDVGLGTNTALSIAFVSANPFNLFYVIFYHLDDNITTAIIVLLKIGLSAASFQFFSRKVLKNEEFSSVIISVFYALSSYVIVFGTVHIMWLDVIYVLPFLCYCLIQCLEEDKRVWLVLTYAYLFVTQFYVAYMAGMFTLLFVIFYLILIYEYSGNAPKIKVFFTKFFNWFLSGIAAAMLAGIIWVPALFFLMGNKVEDATQLTELNSSLLQVLNSLFWGVGYGVLGKYAYIYCGIPVALLAIAFFLNKAFKVKEKIFYGILIGFLMFCVVYTPLNGFMHAFDQPDNFWNRFSFLISFCICVIATKEIKTLKELDVKKLFLISLPLAAFYQLELQLISTFDMDVAMLTNLNTSSQFIINFVLIAAWALLLFLYLKKENLKRAMCLLACLLVLAETVSNAYIVIPQKESSEKFYKEYDEIKTAVETIQERDSGLYRTLCTNGSLSNTAAWFGYRGIGYFSDVEKYSTRKFLSNVGFASSPRWVDQSGYTPVTEMLLGVKYNIMFPNPLMDLEDDPRLNEDRYYENENYLSYGYMVSGETLFYDYSGRDVFENMNDIVQTFSGIEGECFVKVPKDKIQYTELGCYYDQGDEENPMSLTRLESPSMFYVLVDKGEEEYSDAYVQFEFAADKLGYYSRDFFVYGNDNRGDTQYIEARFSNANKMYYNKDKNQFSLYLYGEDGSSPDSLEFDDINVYFLDKEALQKQYEELAKEQLNVTEWKDGYIKGTVNITDYKRLMLITIPFDAGWTAKIDGKEVDIASLLDGAFMGLYFADEGEHTVELKYECPGLRIGLATSLLGIIALLLIAYEKKLKKWDKSLSAKKEDAKDTNKKENIEEEKEEVKEK